MYIGVRGAEQHPSSSRDRRTLNLNPTPKPKPKPTEHATNQYQ